MVKHIDSQILFPQYSVQGLAMMDLGTLDPDTVSEDTQYLEAIGENFMGRISDTVVTLNKSGVDLAGQVFRASGVNVNRVQILAEFPEYEDTNDDFESYASDAALRAVWIESDNPNTPATRNASGSWTGQSMTITPSGAGSVGDMVSKTIAKDWSGYTHLILNVIVGADPTIKVRIGDGVNTKAYEIAAGTSSADLRIAFSDFTEEVGVTDMTALTLLEIEVTASTGADTIEIDDIGAYAEQPAVDIEIHSMASATPTTSGGVHVGATVTVTPDRTPGNNTQFLSAQFSGQALTPGSYYAVVVTSPSNGRNVRLKGRVGGSKYSNGSAITSIDGGTNVTATAASSCWFGVWMRSAGVIIGYEPRYVNTSTGVRKTGYGNFQLAVQSDGGGLAELAHSPDTLDSGEKAKLDIYPLELAASDKVYAIWFSESNIDPVAKLLVDIHYRCAPLSQYG